MFRRPPEEIYAGWDKVWLDRTRVVLQGRIQAATNPDKNDEQKAEQ